jgi:hypothetical protein
MKKLEIIELLEAYKEHVTKVHAHYMETNNREMTISYAGELDALDIVLAVMKSDSSAMQLKRQLGV